MWLVAIAAAFSSGCPDRAASWHEFYATYCELIASCCRKAGLGEDGRTCGEPRGLSHVLEYDPRLGQRCLEAVDALIAEPDFCEGAPKFPGPCGALFQVARGSLAPGDACTAQRDCAPTNEGFVECSGGVCQVKHAGKAGDTPCVETFDGFSGAVYELPTPTAHSFWCDTRDGIYCDRDTVTCVPLQSLDARCEHDDHCAGDTYCAPDTHRCVRGQELGDSCASAPCQSHTYCEPDAKTCRALTGEGAPCSDHRECRWSCLASGLCATERQAAFAPICEAE